MVEDLLLGAILALKSPKSTCGSEGGGGLGWTAAPVSMSDSSSSSLSLALLNLSEGSDDNLVSLRVV